MFCFSIEVFQLTKEDGLVSLEYHYFPFRFELMDLGNDHQWLLASQKERQLDVMYFLMELDYTNSEVILPQNS